MRKKRIGLLFGMEDTFPWALINAINAHAAGAVEAAAVEISCLRDDSGFGYDLILDRISHEVPFYRTFLKCADASGVKVVNNPFWQSADDKFFDNRWLELPVWPYQRPCSCLISTSLRTPRRSRSGT
jgi:hypothetical protein